MGHTLMECLASPVQGGGTEHPHQPPQPDNKKKEPKWMGAAGAELSLACTSWPRSCRLWNRMAPRDDVIDITRRCQHGIER